MNTLVMRSLSDRIVMTTRQISATLMDIYGFEASEGFISDVTDKPLPQIEE